MSEIAKCPICGKAPVKMVFGAGWAQDGYKCCGHTANTLKQWNQYASAMELAKVEVDKQSKFLLNRSKYDKADIHRRNMRLRVLEVFK